MESGILKDVTAAGAQFKANLSKLEKLVEKAHAETFDSVKARSVFYRDKILPAMNALRETSDKLETLLGDEYWPLPTYTDLLFNE